MKASRQITVMASLLLAACMLGTVLLLHRLDQLRTGATLEEALYISSPKLLKRMSLGYDGLLADVYWTRAVQYFGSKHHQGAERYDLLAPLLEITTTLDPQLILAYEYGANFLAPAPPNGAGLPQRAIDLVEYGIGHNPNEWRLYYQLGFIHYTELKDYSGAADAFIRAGERETARMLWSTTYQTAQEHSIRANAAAHLRALQVDEDVTNLEKAVAWYREKTGHFPASFSDLTSAGILRGTPVDPLGHPYKLTPDGRVEVRVPDDLPFIEKGMPQGYVPPKVPKFLPSD
jgi:hypothetical protein